MILAYIRVSTAKQAERGSSLSAQRAAIERYVIVAALNGGGPLRWIEEPGETASTPLLERPGGALLRDAHPDRLHLVTTKLDRLFRDTVDGLTTLDAWDAAGRTTVHLVSEGGADAIDVTSAAGRLALTMRLAIAEYERRVTVERTQAAVDHRRSEGLAIGVAPYGQAMDAEGRLVPHEDEQRVLGVVRGYRAQGLSYRAIAARLTTDGIRSRKGRPFPFPAVGRMLGKAEP